MTANDYKVMLTMHMCDNADCVNARFVWLRVPDKLKEDKDLKLAWQICQELHKNNFKAIFDCLKNKNSELQ
jgi:hypothetical protein